MIFYGVATETLRNKLTRFASPRRVAASRKVRRVAQGPLRGKAGTDSSFEPGTDDEKILAALGLVDEHAIERLTARAFARASGRELVKLAAQYPNGQTAEIVRNLGFIDSGLRVL
jgi:hypothetical protein